LSSAGHPI